jgi:hypothetical protein
MAFATQVAALSGRIGAGLEGSRCIGLGRLAAGSVEPVRRAVATARERGRDRRAGGSPSAARSHGATAIGAPAARHPVFPLGGLKREISCVFHFSL